MSDETTPSGNDLLSEQFSNHIDELFEKLGQEIFHKKSVRDFTRAYYVKTDLESGIELRFISKDRLQSFYYVLWTYICVINTQDEKAKQLFTAVDQQLNDEFKPTHIVE